MSLECCKCTRNYVPGGSYSQEVIGDPASYLNGISFDLLWIGTGGTGINRHCHWQTTTACDITINKYSYNAGTGSAWCCPTLFFSPTYYYTGDVVYVEGYEEVKYTALQPVQYIIPGVTEGWEDYWYIEVPSATYHLTSMTVNIYARLGIIDVYVYAFGDGQVYLVFRASYPYWNNRCFCENRTTNDADTKCYPCEGVIGKDYLALTIGGIAFVEPNLGDIVTPFTYIFPMLNSADYDEQIAYEDTTTDIPQAIETSCDFCYEFTPRVIKVTFSGIDATCTTTTTTTTTTTATTTTTPTTTATTTTTTTEPPDSCSYCETTPRFVEVAISGLSPCGCINQTAECFGGISGLYILEQTIGDPCIWSASYPMSSLRCDFFDGPNCTSKYDEQFYPYIELTLWRSGTQLWLIVDVCTVPEFPIYQAFLGHTDSVSGCVDGTIENTILCSSYIYYWGDGTANVSAQ